MSDKSIPTIEDITRDNNVMLTKICEHIDQLNDGPYLDVVQAAKFLHISKSQLLKNVKKHIPFSRLGNVLLFEKTELAKYVRSKKIKPGH